MSNPTGVVTSELKTKSVLIDTNLSGKEYYFVNMDTTDDGVVNLAADGSLPLFILTEGKDGSTGGTKVGTIATEGRTKLKIAASITAGNYLKSDGSGKGIVATTGTNAGAIAMESGASGDLIEVQIVQVVVP